KHKLDENLKPNHQDMSENRPLSPHLQIYRWQWSMTYSIMHRISGVIISFALLWVVLWLMALACTLYDYDGGHGVDQIYHFMVTLSASIFGQCVLALFTWAAFYHLYNGLRHLVWDVGFGFELYHARLSGHVVFVLSILSNLMIWFVF
ncbi:MAG: succinate dehydrogenase, cytochrome b556 subunit, partial [Pseudomonadota bacterium]